MLLRSRRRFRSSQKRGKAKRREKEKIMERIGEKGSAASSTPPKDPILTFVGGVLGYLFSFAVANHTHEDVFRPCSDDDNTNIQAYYRKITEDVGLLATV